MSRSQCLVCQLWAIRIHGKLATEKVPLIDGAEYEESYEGREKNRNTKGIIPWGITSSSGWRMVWTRSQTFYNLESPLQYTVGLEAGKLPHLTLIAEVPVWGHVICKVECANHATKCYRVALEKLVERCKGRGKLTKGMRKRTTGAALCAIKMRSSIFDKNSQPAAVLYNGSLESTQTVPQTTVGPYRPPVAAQTDTHTENTAHKQVVNLLLVVRLVHHYCGIPFICCQDYNVSSLS